MKHIVIFSIIFFLLSGCSRFEWYREYNECQPCKGAAYRVMCDSGSFSLTLGWTMRLRMLGPPYIPVIPVPNLDNIHQVHAFIWPHIDSLYHVYDAPEFALRIKGSNVLLNPIRIDTSGRAPEVGYYEYLFDIGNNSSDTLETVFLKKYNGCDLPPVTFIPSEITKYEYFIFPGDG